jgi:uncharacterized protein
LSNAHPIPPSGPAPARDPASAGDFFTAGDVVAGFLAGTAIIALGAVFVTVALAGAHTSAVAWAMAGLSAVAMCAGVGVALLRREAPLAAVGLSRVPWRVLPRWAGVALLCIPAMGAVAAGVRWLLGRSLENPQFDLLAPENIGPGTIVLSILILGVLVPFAEELTFRGLLFHALRQRYGPALSIGLTSALFGAVHFLPGIAAATALLGVVMAIAVERTGSLWPAVAIHATNNTVSLIVMFATVG